jgi:hypothetical protein
MMTCSVSGSFAERTGSLMRDTGEALHERVVVLRGIGDPKLEPLTNAPPR